MFRRGFTLLELLIAIALLLALGALSVPAIVGRVSEYRYESALDVTTGHLLLARAHAQSTGRTVEVLYRSPPARLEARFFQPGEMIESNAAGGSNVDQERAAADDGDRTDYYSLAAEEDYEETGVIPEGWALQALPDGIHISATPPNMDDEAYGLLSPSPDFDYDSWGEGFSPPVAPSAYEEDEEPVTIRLAVFLPDGSALICDPAWLFDDELRQGRLTVNPWSGLPAFERSADPTDDEAFEPEEEEPEELAEEEDFPFSGRSPSDEPPEIEE